MPNTHTLLLASTVAVLTVSCKEGPKVVNEVAPNYSLTTHAGKKIEVPDPSRDQLLYFFASW